jgi:ABC-type antimicrobial peptide transport system permease subunit
MRAALAGVAVGLALGFAFARALRSLLFGVGVADPLTFASVPAVLLVVAVAACYLPARRAAAVDPVTTLRAD